VVRAGFPGDRISLGERLGFYSPPSEHCTPGEGALDPNLLCFNDLSLAQRFGRHVSPLNTTIYTHPSDQEMWERVRSLPC